MRAAIPVSPLVARSELAFTENLVGSLLGVLGELRVDLAGVDQKRCLGLGFVFLTAKTSRWHRIDIIHTFDDVPRGRRGLSGARGGKRLRRGRRF